jgi:hypothetical protein
LLHNAKTLHFPILPKTACMENLHHILVPLYLMKKFAKLTVWHHYVRIFHRTPAGYTADRKTRRKSNMSCYVLLSAVSNPPLLPATPPPHCAPISPACGCVIRIRRTRESSPSPTPPTPMVNSEAAAGK